jgi:hypothetical protein
VSAVTDHKHSFQRYISIVYHAKVQTLLLADTVQPIFREVERDSHLVLANIYQNLGVVVLLQRETRILSAPVNIPRCS